MGGSESLHPLPTSCSFLLLPVCSWNVMSLLPDCQTSLRPLMPCLPTMMACTPLDMGTTMNPSSLRCFCVLILRKSSCKKEKRSGSYLINGHISYPLLLSFLLEELIFLVEFHKEESKQSVAFSIEKLGYGDNNDRSWCWGWGGWCLVFVNLSVWLSDYCDTSFLPWTLKKKKA